MTMKFKSMLGVAMMAAIAFTATSCSDDDNDGNNSEGNYIKGTNFQTGIEPHAIGFTIGSQLIGTK